MTLRRRRSSTPAPVLIALLVVLALGATIARAASAGGSLSVTKAIIEHQAVVGQVDSVVLANTTTTGLKITVTPRPWVASPGGRVVPNPKATLSSLITVSRPSFTLPAGASQSVNLTLKHAPPGGSLYASIESIGIPVDASKQKGVTVGYRLISKLRLDPPTAARKLKLTVGTPLVQGASVVLPVRNAGNTIDPVSGTAKITSPLGGRNVVIAAQRIVPGATGNLSLTPVKGLKPGRYVVTYVLLQNNRKVASASHPFTLS